MGKNVRHRKRAKSGSDQKQEDNAGSVKETDTKEDKQDKPTDVKKDTVTRPPPPDSRWWILYKFVLFVIFILPIIVACLGMVLVTSPTKPIKIRVPPPPEWTGPLEPNQILASAERLFQGQLVGPESIAVRNGHIYTGTADGKVLHIENGQVKELVRFGKPPCKLGGDYESEPRCGRPLGMRLDNDGHLIVIDTYYGIFKVDVATGDHQQLLSSDDEVAGAKPVFLNDLDISSDGTTIYFSESSLKWQRNQFMMPLLEGRGDGRLVKYDIATKTAQVLMSGLFFANGVQLSPDEDFVLVSELGKHRIMKYHLKGPKKGRREEFAKDLPGLPDNIRSSHSGGYWVALVAQCPQDQGFNLYEFLASKPQLRKQITKLPIPWIQMSLLLPSMPKCTVVVELDQDGNIVRSLHDPEHKAVGLLSQVEDDNGMLYLGSFHAPFIGKLDLTGDQ